MGEKANLLGPQNPFKYRGLLGEAGRAQPLFPFICCLPFFSLIQLEPLLFSLPTGQSWRCPATSPSLRSKLASTCGTSSWALSTVSEGLPGPWHWGQGTGEGYTRQGVAQTELALSSFCQSAVIGQSGSVGGRGVDLLSTI